MKGAAKHLGVPQTPPKRVEGRTFEFVFPLPGAARSAKTVRPSKNTAPKTRKDRAAGTSSPAKPDDRVHRQGNNRPLQETPSAKTNDTRRDRQAYNQARRKTPERKEYNRRYEQERRKRAKELGQCRDCDSPAIPGQTRCPACAEAHRQSNRRSDARRKAAAKEADTAHQADPQAE